MDEDHKRLLAQERVTKLKGFYGHLATYATVMTLLLIIDWATGDGWWFQWPLIGWGIAVALHALRVFVLDRVFGAKWEEQKVDELVRRG